MCAVRASESKSRGEEGPGERSDSFHFIFRFSVQVDSISEL